MTDYTRAERKRIASDQLTIEPDFVGRDATGADHFWSYYDREIVVVGPDGTYETHHVGSRPLGHWRDFVAQERGWEGTPNVGGGILEGAAVLQN